MLSVISNSLFSSNSTKIQQNMKPQKSQRLCVLNIGQTHTIARTIAIAPFFGEVYYLDVTEIATPKDFEGTKVIHKQPFGSNQSRFLGVFKLVKYLNKLNPDLIVCFYPVGPMYLAALLYRRCPVVGVAMGSDVFYERGDTHIPALERLLRRMCLRETTMIIAKSHTLMERIREFDVVCPIFVNYWGCDLKRFTPGSRKEARVRLGLPLDHFIVLSSRGIGPSYNIDMILEAVNLACSEILNLHLVVIGRTSKSQQEYQNKLEMYVEENGIEECSSLIWDVDQDKVSDYIRAADIVVTAARSEGFPNTVLEVLASGRPVVAVELPQFHELLTDGQNVVFCEHSARHMASKLIWLSRSPEIVEKLAQGGNHIAAKHGNIEENGRAFASQLKELLPMQNKTLSNFSAFCLFSVYLISQCLNRMKLFISMLK